MGDVVRIMLAIFTSQNIACWQAKRLVTALPWLQFLKND